MNIARILYPIEVLGPGKRIGIWVAGCTRKCKGCSNPELWEQKPEYEISVEQLISLIERISHDNEIDGFTFSGGEPLNQAGELAQLLQCIRIFSTDIIVYTGYTMEKLLEKQNTDIQTILESIAVLIDGEYVEELNDDTFLRGSSNQRIHIINPIYECKYLEYLKNGHNQIQNFTTSDGVVSVGIHHKTFTSL